MIRERLRAWTYRAGLELVTRDGLANVSARLVELVDAINGLGAYVRVWRDAVQRSPSFVTVLVIGVDAKTPLTPDGRTPIIFAATGRVPARGGNPISVEILRPLVHCSVVVLADLERVDVRGLFIGSEVLTMVGPVAFFESATPGYQVRALCELRE